MKFSIVTPSFRSSPWLKLCIASVADQEGVDLEHIVQDSCSDDGTQVWLPLDQRVKAFIEKDSGMYDNQANELFDLHAHRPGSPGELRRSQTHGCLVEQALINDCNP